MCNHRYGQNEPVHNAEKCIANDTNEGELMLYQNIRMLNSITKQKRMKTAPPRLMREEKK